MRKIEVNVERLPDGLWVGRLTGFGSGVQIKKFDTEQVITAIRQAVAEVEGAPSPLPMTAAREFTAPAPRFARHGPRDNEAAPLESAVPPISSPPPQPRHPIGKREAAKMRAADDEAALSRLSPVARAGVIAAQSGRA